MLTPSHARNVLAKILNVVGVVVVVSVRVLRTPDFIDDLDTQLHHNRPSLVMLTVRLSGVVACLL